MGDEEKDTLDGQGQSFEDMEGEVGKSEGDKSDDVKKGEETPIETTSDKVDDVEQKSPDAEDEEASDDDSAEDDADVPPIQGIPPARLAKAIAKGRDAEARADALEAELAEARSGRVQNKDEKQDAVDINDLYTQVEEARLDGEAQKAAKIQQQIDAHNQQQILAKTSAPTGITDQQLAQISLKNMVTTAEKQHAVLNKNHDDFDSDTVDDVNGWHKIYVEQGIPLDEAFELALDKVIPPSASEMVGKTVEARKKAAKGAQHAVDNSPNLSNNGEGAKDHHKGVDISNLNTFEEMSKISDEQLDKMAYSASKK